MKTLQEIEDQLTELNKDQEADQDLITRAVKRISSRAGIIELVKLDKQEFLREQNHQLLNALENTQPCETVVK